MQEPVGTHGSMKVQSDSPIQQQDAVCISMYKRVFQVPTKLQPCLGFLAGVAFCYRGLHVGLHGHFQYLLCFRRGRLSLREREYSILLLSSTQRPTGLALTAYRAFG